MAGKVAKSLARFIEPMECLPVPKLQAGQGWLFELLCGGLHKISYVVSILMFCRDPESVSLLAVVALNTT